LIEKKRRLYIGIRDIHSEAVEINSVFKGSTCVIVEICIKASSTTITQLVGKISTEKSLKVIIICIVKYVKHECGE